MKSKPQRPPPLKRVQRDGQNGQEEMEINRISEMSEEDRGDWLCGASQTTVHANAVYILTLIR